MIGQARQYGRAAGAVTIQTHRRMSLYQAACCGDVEAVAALLRDGVDVNENVSTGITPTAIMGAAKHGHTGIVRMLADAGASLQVWVCLHVLHNSRPPPCYPFPSGRARYTLPLPLAAWRA